VEYREATADDVATIAGLHAESWRRHYRGAFLDSYLDADPVWGAFLDNLHVRPDVKRQGVGTRLMADTARAVLGRSPSSGLYLWVLEQNTAAQAFYQAQGGRPVERQLTGPFPGGGQAYSFRYAWPDLSRLATPG
jgi:ribosomal protein S18 acetylase RimI-like enzyme